MRPLGIALATCALLACERARAPSGPHLPPGRAGEILSGALEAAGGWERWRSRRDASFISSTVYFHALAGDVRESVGVYEMPLHGEGAVRFESLDERAAVVTDGTDTWLEREGVPVCDPPRLAHARVHLLANRFWFSLPFSLAEESLRISAAGDESRGNTTWTRLRVDLPYDRASPAADWYVVSFDAATRLVDHVLATCASTSSRILCGSASGETTATSTASASHTRTKSSRRTTPGTSSAATRSIS